LFDTEDDGLFDEIVHGSDLHPAIDASLLWVAHLLVLLTCCIEIHRRP